MRGRPRRLRGSAGESTGWGFFLCAVEVLSPSSARTDCLAFCRRVGLRGIVMYVCVVSIAMKTTTTKKGVLLLSTHKQFLKLRKNCIARLKIQNKKKKEESTCSMERGVGIEKEKKLLQLLLQKIKPQNRTYTLSSSFDPIDPIRLLSLPETKGRHKHMAPRSTLPVEVGKHNDLQVSTRCTDMCNCQPLFLLPYHKY